MRPRGVVQNMMMLSTNTAYHNCEQQTTQQWLVGVFSGGNTRLLDEESLTVEEEIGEGTFGKVFKGLFCDVCWPHIW